MKELRLHSGLGTIRYHDLPGTKIPILFIHGLGCTSSFDYPQLASMGGLENHRRILVDLMGSGFSDKPEAFDYSIHSHASSLEELIQALGLDQVILYGHSMGGSVATTLATRMQKQLCGLLLSESNLDAGGGFFSQKIAAYTEKAYLKVGHQALIQQSIDEGNESWAASLSVNSAIATHRSAVSLIKGGSPSWRDSLYALSCPKAYLFGEHSLPDPDYDELAAQGVPLVIVPDAGHSMAWENPAGLAKAIKDTIHAWSV